MDIQTLYKLHRNEILMYISRIETEESKAIPFIIARISLEVVPNMMRDLAVVKGMTGKQKKQLIIDTVIFSVDTIFKELNANTRLSRETWDEHVRDVLLILLPETIDKLFEVENGKLKIVTRSWFEKWCCCGQKGE